MGHVFLSRWIRLCRRFLSGHQAVLMFDFTTLRFVASSGEGPAEQYEE